ncbi:hypothetical protein HanHA300_Chr04g0152191 [Helianthus annuus]|nr:hypothetical protein HanHA300_Chr04g0152191 [Helianthus annuus]KAJ0590671.1 hypothetical protein HanIR_Chr04g0200081 [Helianthus annuus]KAJ0598415.1 hypothetical protein HanHA89_Chr04g0165561 [Helianthus annuus]
MVQELINHFYDSTYMSLLNSSFTYTTTNARFRWYYILLFQKLIAVCERLFGIPLVEFPLLLNLVKLATLVIVSQHLVHLTSISRTNSVEPLVPTDAKCLYTHKI